MHIVALQFELKGLTTS